MDSGHCSIQCDRSRPDGVEMSTESMRRRVWELLDVGSASDPLSRGVDIAMIALISANVLAVIVESVEDVYLAHAVAFERFDQFSVIVFTLEYLLRLWSVVERGAGSPFRQRLRFARSPLAIVDLLAFAPYYLSFGFDLRFLRGLRLLRFLKLTRYSSATQLLSEVVWQERNTLSSAFFILCMVLTGVSSAMYWVERDIQPEEFGSIPASMWWAIATLTTVGYGDVTPMTTVGKGLASLVMVVGIGTVALPTSILASGFAHVAARKQRRLQRTLDSALEDGVLDDEEAREFRELALRLGVQSEVAADLVRRAKVVPVPEFDTCRHCGKDLAPAGSRARYT